MKILMINKYYFIKGGSERYMFELKELLEQHGHEVIPFSMEDSQNEPSEYSPFFVDHIQYEFESSLQKFIQAPKVLGRMIYSLQAKERVEQLISRTRPDIAHIHMIDHQISPSILPVLKKYGIPVVQTVHQYKLVCPNYRMYIPRKAQVCERCLTGGTLNAILQRCHKNSFVASAMVALESAIHRRFKIYQNHIDWFIVPSRFLGKKLIQGGFAPEKIKTIYHFIDCHRYPYNQTFKDYYVFYGRISEEKGLLTLLHSARKLPQLKLKIVGDGPMLPVLMNFVKQNQMEQVEFVGKKHGKELKQIISNAMFVVLPSEWYENSPMVIYESFAMGKPVIGSKIGGITELIRHQKDGLLFTMGNVEELAHRINYLATHPEKIVQFGKAARQRAEHDFNPNKHYQNIMDLYCNLLNLEPKQNNLVETPLN